MEFDNSFSVRAPLSLVWDFMLDANEVTPCVPGAQLTETVDETHFKGTMKVKLGAVQMTYRGEMEMLPDESSRTIVLQAKGTEMRGSGGASGTFTTRLSQPEEGLTEVQIHTKVDVTGRVAQFGRGIMQDVANRMIKDFASCLEQKLTARAQPQEAAPEEPVASSVQEEATPSSAGSLAAPTSPGSTAAPAPGSTPSSAPSSPSSPAASSPPSSTEPNVLKLQDLILDITRTRMAAGLRKLASLIEPK